MKPAYEKAATSLAGLAKVAAIDCDEETNKPLCGSMGVQGFPTLKIFRPGKKAGRPVVEDYQGARTASAIADAVASKISNHVTRVTDKDVDKFLEGEGPKAILFTEKGTTSALLRSVAIDYLSVISVAQARNKEKKLVEKFGIEKFPSLVLIPGDGKDTVTYTGELNKKDIVDFLKQAGEPNPDPAPAGKKGEKKAEKKEKKAEKKPKAEKKKEEEAKQDDKTTNEEAKTEPEAAPAAPQVKTIDIISSADTLTQKCLQAKSHTCILAFLPSESTTTSQKVVDSLSQLNTKYIQGNRQVFPFLGVPSSVEGVSSVKDALKLSAEVELVAINARRKWWRQYEGDFGAESVETWMDAIRMGEGSKNKLPKSLIVQEATEETAKEPVEEAVKEPEQPVKEDDGHDEL